MATTFTVKIKLKTSDDCRGCPLTSCGHFGDDVYCLLGMGEIKILYRDKRSSKNPYWKRPGKCKNTFNKK